MSIIRTFCAYKSARWNKSAKKAQGLHLVDDLFLVIA